MSGLILGHWRCFPACIQSQSKVGELDLIHTEKKQNDTAHDEIGVGTRVYQNNICRRIIVGQFGYVFVCGGRNGVLRQ